jgi:radical SAM superfamily enzyme YgiQ (UPF0313 family)
MGERSIVEIADALDGGVDVHDISWIAGTVYRARTTEQCVDPVTLPTWEAMRADKTEYARSFGIQRRNLNPYLSHPLVEEYDHGACVIQNPPTKPLTTPELDAVYELPYVNDVGGPTADFMQPTCPKQAKAGACVDRRCLAPEPCPNLRVMGKPSNDVYERFVHEFEKASRECGKEQYVVPYLMSSHPGSTMEGTVKLAEFCRDLGYNPEQVSDFYPTPSTVSTRIYYTGLDPRTMKHVYCPTNPHEKAMQRALIQYRVPKNYDLVVEALHRAHREDLIGYGPKCLVRPERPRQRTGGGRAGGGGRRSRRKR